MLEATALGSTRQRWKSDRGSYRWTTPEMQARVVWPQSNRGWPFRSRLLPRSTGLNPLQNKPRLRISWFIVLVGLAEILRFGVPGGRLLFAVVWHGRIIRRAGLNHGIL